MNLPWQHQIILVIGSLHLDVFGDFSGQDGITDKTGETYFAAGGTGFNIAAYLGLGKQHVALLSVLAKDSIISAILKYKLRMCRIESRYVFETLPDRNSSASAFVAHRSYIQHRMRETVTLHSAVSWMPIENLKFGDQSQERRYFDDALSRSKLIVVDANLAGKALETILTAAHRKQIRVVAVATSDAKIARVATVQPGTTGARFLIVALRLNELARLDGGSFPVPPDNRWSADAITALCNRLHSDGILLNRGTEDPLLLLGGSSPRSISIPMPEPTANVKSFTGVGSALVAAVVAAATARNRVPESGALLIGDDDVTALTRFVDEYVGKAFRTWAATPGAGIEFDDDEAKASRSWYRRIIGNARGFAVRSVRDQLIEWTLSAIIGAALTIAGKSAIEFFQHSIEHH